MSEAKLTPSIGSPSRPHINIERKRSSWEDWCVHYAGFYKPGVGKGAVTHCDVGVEYAFVERKVDYTYSRDGGHKYESKTAHPCFKHQHHLTDGCAKCHFPTPDEIKAHHEETDATLTKMFGARNAIITELDRRHKTGDAAVILKARSDSEYDDGDDGPKNYISGAGVIDCPVCKTGKLRYSRAAYNGHIHAKCSTDGCVAWME